MVCSYCRWRTPPPPQPLIVSDINLFKKLNKHEILNFIKVEKKNFRIIFTLASFSQEMKHLAAYGYLGNSNFKPWLEDHLYIQLKQLIFSVKLTESLHFIFTFIFMQFCKIHRWLIIKTSKINLHIYICKEGTHIVSFWKNACLLNLIEWKFTDPDLGWTLWSRIVELVENLSKDKLSYFFENLYSFWLNLFSRDFSWSPTDNIIAYWVPEESNTPARVTLIEIPSRNELCVRNLFNVADCKMHWQKSGDHLCVKVDRYSKAKKVEEKDQLKYSVSTTEFYIWNGFFFFKMSIYKVHCSMTLNLKIQNHH